MSQRVRNLTLSFATLLSFLVSTVSLADAANRNFPETPDMKMTPGSTCARPNAYRYPEKVPYCERGVESETKWAIIREYDTELGYSIERTGRVNFKIDHLIPLCMGGSNEVTNLWPQHKSIYELTDPLEPVLCGKMAEGRMSQVQAIDIIRRAKQNPTEAPQILKELGGKQGHR